jgi:hypothetical protein
VPANSTLPTPLQWSALLLCSTWPSYIHVFYAWPDGRYVKYWMTHCGQLEYQYKNRMPKQETRVLQRTQGQSLSPVYNIKFTNYR